ncbi:MAG: M20/M25/M40 family metallo-hydrolase, partial [Clostridia bacterium]|nr:M20/M25/M40 family metallo-hydrolase [Clostridia bacterium]
AYPGDVTCLFVTQEKVGCRGSMPGVFGLKNLPDIAIVLEGTTCNDLGDVPDPLKVCKAGEGVAVSFMDNASIACRPLYLKLLETAKENGIPHQVKQFVSGGNDAGVMQRTKSGVMTCVLSVPCRYIHSPSSAVCLKDVEAQAQLAMAFLKDPRL